MKKEKKKKCFSVGFELSRAGFEWRVMEYEEVKWRWVK